MKSKSSWVGLAIALFIFSSANSAGASEITDGLKATIDTVISIVTQPGYKEHRAERRKLVRDIIDKKFNYLEMGRRSLAKNWRKRSRQEKKEFIKLFGELLENSYASKIESYRDEKIEYASEKIKGKYAMVKTIIHRKDGTVAVDYKMIKTGNDWQVYDFVIEGVSMVRNYRSQFTKIIRNESYDALVKKMNSKITELNSPG